jgi:predicted amidohydrolase YtcJ
MPEMDKKLLTKLIKEQISDCHKMGLCGVHSFESRSGAELVASIAPESNFYFTWYYLLDDELKLRKEPFSRRRFIKENSHFRNGGIKLFSDGSLNSDTAWMFEHKSPPEQSYLDNLYSLIAKAHQQDIQVAVHVIGDQAVHTLAKMIIKVNDNNPMMILLPVMIVAKKDYLKHRLEHLQAVRPEDLRLLKKANVHASMQAIHIKEDEALIKQKWPVAKEYSFPLKSVMDTVEMALGSDAPVETLNPFEGIYQAVNRDNFLPNEAITVVEALKAYAYKHHIIANKKVNYGMIKGGQIANLIVVDKNLLTDLGSFKNYTTEMTMVDGVVV